MSSPKEAHSQHSEANAMLLDEHAWKSPRKPASFSVTAHWITHATSLITLLFVILRTSQMQETPRAQENVVWTPAQEALRDKTFTKPFKGTFAAWTEYKGYSPEAEKAWSFVLDTETIRLSREDMIRMGRSLDSVQYPEEFGGGYMGTTEGIHQMHCLNTLREYHYIEHFPRLQDIKANNPLFFEQHYEHCLDIVRQRIMCTADPGIVTFNWVENVKGVYPDFNTEHVCHNFDALLEWNKEFEVVLPVDGYNWTAPEGGVKLPHVP